MKISLSLNTANIKAKNIFCEFRAVNAYEIVAFIIVLSIQNFSVKLFAAISSESITNKRAQTSFTNNTSCLSDPFLFAYIAFFVSFSCVCVHNVIFDHV